MCILVGRQLRTLFIRGVEIFWYRILTKSEEISLRKRTHRCANNDDTRVDYSLEKLWWIDLNPQEKVSGGQIICNISWTKSKANGTHQWLVM